MHFTSEQGPDHAKDSLLVQEEMSNLCCCQPARILTSHMTSATVDGFPGDAVIELVPALWMEACAALGASASLLCSFL